MDVGQWLQGRERLLLLVLVFLFPVIGYFAPIKFPITPSESTLRVHEAVHRSPSHAVVLVLFEAESDFGRGLSYAFRAFLEDAFHNRLRVVVASLYSDGGALAGQQLQAVAQRHTSVEYGRDYINLGFIGGRTETLQELREGVPQRVLEAIDSRGQPFKAYPLVRDFYGLDAVSLVAVFVPGDLQGQTILDDVQRVMATKRVPLVGAVSGFGVGRSASHPGYEGIIASSYGAAEYEEVLGFQGPAQQQVKYVGLAALTLCLLIVGVATAEGLRYSRERRAWRERLQRQGRLDH